MILLRMLTSSNHRQGRWYRISIVYKCGELRSHPCGFISYSCSGAFSCISFVSSSFLSKVNSNISKFATSQAFVLTMSSLLSFFRPTVDAIFSTIPFKWRWRLLLLQPIYALSWCMTALPWVFSRRYSVLWIPIRTGQKVRTIVFQPPRKEGDKRLRPLHLDIHGGAFIGGAAEYDARWCAALSERTGAVVVSSQYRYAPRYTFPAAINDIDDVVAYLLKNAESDLGADPKLLTIGGSSAGGNLALAACQQLALQHPSPTSVKAAVTFCALVSHPHILCPFIHLSTLPCNYLQPSPLLICTG